MDNSVANPVQKWQYKIPTSVSWEIQSKDRRELKIADFPGLCVASLKRYLINI